MEVVGIIGTGRLGLAIAERLIAARFEVVGYDTDTEAVRQLEEAGGRFATPFEIVLRCRRIISALPSHDLVLSALPGARAGTIVIDTTNATPEQSQETAAILRARGVGYLDAPVCDWHETVRAQGGKVVCGGDASAVSACRDIFAAFAHPFIHAGPSGEGARMKLELEKDR